MIKHKCLYEAPQAEITALLVRAGMLLNDSPLYGDEGAAGTDTADEDYGEF